jgi:hypothetical protein
VKWRVKWTSNHGPEQETYNDPITAHDRAAKLSVYRDFQETGRVVRVRIKRRSYKADMLRYKTALEKIGLRDDVSPWTDLFRYVKHVYEGGEP